MVRKRIAAAMLAGMLVGVAPAGAALANHEGSGPAGSHICQGLVQARASVLGALGDGNGSVQSSIAHKKVAQKLLLHVKKCSSAF